MNAPAMSVSPEPVTVLYSSQRTEYDGIFFRYGSDVSGKYHI
jgi:hypothetical protein